MLQLNLLGPELLVTGLQLDALALQVGILLGNAFLCPANCAEEGERLQEREDEADHGEAQEPEDRAARGDVDVAPASLGPADEVEGQSKSGQCEQEIESGRQWEGRPRRRTPAAKSAIKTGENRRTSLSFASLLRLYHRQSRRDSARAGRINLQGSKRSHGQAPRHRATRVLGISLKG